MTPVTVCIWKLALNIRLWCDHEASFPSDLHIDRFFLFIYRSCLPILKSNEIVNPRDHLQHTYESYEPYVIILKLYKIFTEFEKKKRSAPTFIYLEILTDRMMNTDYIYIYISI